MIKRKHSPETKARMAELMRSRSAEISRLTKERMADPEVRKRIRDGMQAASGEATEIQVLRMAWAAARPSARTRFLTELTKADEDRQE
ncbi:hypothetical protein ACVMIH_005180 [Bradyrhizobium sp. USDA 4503]